MSDGFSNTQLQQLSTAISDPINLVLGPAVDKALYQGIETKIKPIIITSITEAMSEVIASTPSKSEFQALERKVLSLVN